MIHRLAVTASVKAAQLRHLIKVVSTEERITMRVLPANILVPGGFLPKASFFLYGFPDPSDPTLAVVDTVTADVVFTQRGELGRHSEMYDRSRHAALPVDDTMAFLEGMAKRLTDQTIEHMTEHRIDWRKSRRSEPSGECVEVARLADDIDILNSRPEAQHTIPRPTYARVTRTLPRQE